MAALRLLLALGVVTLLGCDNSDSSGNPPSSSTRETGSTRSQVTAQMPASWPARPPGAATQPKDQIEPPKSDTEIKLMAFGEFMPRFSDGQKVKLEDISKEMRAKAEKNPDLAKWAEAHRDEAQAQGLDTLLAILTDDQKGDFEAAVRRERENDNRHRCWLNVMKLGGGIERYAIANRSDQFPPDIGTAIIWAELDPRRALCASRQQELPSGFADLTLEQQVLWLNEHSDYVYRGAGHTWKDELVLVHDKFHNHDSLFLKGVVNTYSNGEDQIRAMSVDEASQKLSSR